MKKVKESSKQLIKGASIVMIGLFLGKLISYIYTILIARIGSEVFGLYSLGISITSFLIVISLFGLNSGIVRYISYYRTKGDEPRIRGIIRSSLKIAIPLSIFFFFILFIFSSFISNKIFHNSDLTFVLKILAITIPIIVITEIFLSIFTAFKKIEYKVCIVEVFEKLIRIITAFILIYIGFTLKAAIFSYVISIIISLILSAYFLQKVFHFFKNNIKTIEIKKELLFYSFPLLFSGVLISIVKWIDTIMIGFFRSVSEVGVYNVALSTSYLMVIIPTAIMSLFLPIITENYSKKKYKEIKDISKNVIRWIFTLNIIAFTFILTFSKEILRLMFGQEYTLGNSSLIILSIGYLIFSFAHVHSNYLIMIKKTKLILLINLAMVLLNISLNLYLIPSYGIIGGAIATSLSLIISYVLSFYFSYRFSKINPYDLKLAKPLLASLIPFFAILFTKGLFSINMVTIIISGIIFLIFYILILFIIKGIDKEDLEIIKLIRNKLK